MTYTQDNIDAVAQNAVGAIYYNLFVQDGTRSLAESERTDNLIMNISPLCREMNAACGTRARKSLGTLCAVLTSRGIVWEETSDDKLSVTIGGCKICVAYKKGIEIALDIESNIQKPHFMHCTAAESDIADFIEFIASADAASRLLVERRYQEASRRRMISEVEFPAVEREVADFLVPRGFKYTLENDRGKNILSIQINKDIWMRKAVSFESIAQDLGIVPYLIMRPDRVNSDGRGFAIFHNWNWDKQRK